MFKKIVSLSIILCIILMPAFLFTYPDFEIEYMPEQVVVEVDENNKFYPANIIEDENQGRVAELKELVTMLSQEERNVGFAAFIRHNKISVNDERFTTLQKLNCLIHEANEIQSRARGKEPHIIISFFSEPFKGFSNTFFIAFTSEEYFELVDFFLDYTGITRDELEVAIKDPIVIYISEERFYCAKTYGVPLVHEPFVPGKVYRAAQPPVLLMGQHLVYRRPDTLN